MSVYVICSSPFVMPATVPTSFSVSLSLSLSLGSIQLVKLQRAN